MTTIIEQKISYSTLELESFIETDRVLNDFGYQRMSKYISHAFLKKSIGNNPNVHQIMNDYVKCVYPFTRILCTHKMKFITADLDCQ